MKKDEYDVIIIGVGIGGIIYAYYLSKVELN
jgi:L-2-hydroxyglutarate oxidase LhgO